MYPQNSECNTQISLGKPMLYATTLLLQTQINMNIKYQCQATYILNRICTFRDKNDTYLKLELLN